MDKCFISDVPEAPIISNILCRETQALISWTPAFDNHDKITDYLVEYSTGFEPDIWKRGLVRNIAIQFNLKAVNYILKMYTVSCLEMCE